MKHIWVQEYINKSPRLGEFMNKKRDELASNYGGKWVWYSAHGKCIAVPVIEFDKLDLWIGVYDRYIEIVSEVVIDKPKSLIDIFEQTDLSIPEISMCCAYLIKYSGYKFDVCRTGHAVTIRR